MNFQDILRARPLVAQHLKKDFAAFCRAVWPHLHPGAKLSWTTAHDLICEYMVCVFEKKLTRLIVNCPPRFAKSSIVTILFPIWVWLQDPTKAFLCCSYEIDLATNHNLDRRRLMDSKWFRDLFADAFTLSTDRSQAQEFSNTSGGVMQAASTNSKAMGRGGDIVVCDDPLSGDVAYSDSFRNEVNFWFEHQLPQRLNNPSESAIIVVMQRLHQNDPSGFLLSQEDSEWKLLKLPLIAEEDTAITFPVSGRVWKRKKGDCLDPKRWSPRAVRERQRNRLVWAGQFQQEPMAAEGNIIRTDDILYFGGRDPQTGVMDPALPETFERKIVSVDAAFKDLRTSDYVAIIVVGIVGSRRYLLHATNAHLDLVATMNEIRNAHAAFGPISAVLVESAANGVSVIAHLKEEIAGLVPITAKDSKMARLVAASPEFQAHNWFIERNGPWTHKVIEQLTMFPNCKNDDLADAISQASIWLQANTYELGLLDYFKKVASGAYDKSRAFAEKTFRFEERMLRRMGQIKGAINQPAAANTNEPAMPAFCPHCGQNVLDRAGNNKFQCLRCLKYCDGTAITMIDETKCPKCGGNSAVIAGMRRCQQCGGQWWPDGAPEFPTVSRRRWQAREYSHNRYGRFG
jgi:predicted phage terminase large subunit-like protein